MNAKDMLNELGEMRAVRETAARLYEVERARVLATVQDQLDALDVEWGPKLTAADTNIASLEAAVRDAVMAEGESVKGDKLHAVYSAGKTTWDTPRLEGYAAAHPELLDFRRQGAPYITIRAAK